MAANDLQATISTRLGQTLSSMSRVEQRIKSLEEATKRTNRAGRDYQRQQKKNQDEDQKRNRLLDQSGKKLKAFSEALSRLGGPVATLAGQIGGSAGMGGALARVGVAFGVAAAAGVAYGRVVEANILRTQKAIEAEQKLAQARREGRQAERQQAEAGLGQEEQIRRLVARGGPEAVRRADQLIAEGVNPSDARAGVARVQSVRGDRTSREEILDAAQRISRTGEISFADAVDRIASSRRLTAGVDFRFGAASNQDAALARVLSDVRGERVTAQEFRDIESRIESDPFLQRAQQARGITGQIDAVQRQRVIAGQAEVAARERLGEAIDPVSAREAQLFREISEQVRALDRLADAQGDLIGLLRDLTSAEGSFFTQAARLRNAQAAAAFGSGD